MNIFYIFAVGSGIAIAFFSQAREFYYLAVLCVIAGLYFSFKKKEIGLTDLLILFITTIPLHTFRFGSQEQFIRLSEIAFIPLAAWWLITRFLNRTQRPLKINLESLFILAYIIINVLATKNSMLPLISVKRIIILSYLFLFTIIVSDIINTKDKTAKILTAMALISGISAIIAILQSIIPQLLFFNRVPIGSIFGLTFYRAGVGWHDPNYYALYLGMNAAMTFCYILATPKNKQLLFKACFVLQLLGIMATFSRTVMGSLILVCLYLLFYYGKRKSALAILTLILLSSIIITTTIPIIYKKYPLLASIIYRIPEREKLKEDPVLIMGHRYAAFKANWAMFLDHPILGVGPFMAMYNYDKYQPIGYKYEMTQLASHNQYLQLLSEKGIFGFIIFLWLILLILKKISAGLKQPLGPDKKTYLMALKSAIFVYLISSFSLETSYELQFWLTIGLSLAILKLIEKERSNVL
ncbi:MAG: O-antigen ligase family protein [Candidatus Omnitrophota bacterium]